jgi:hypothetical protein
MTLRKLYVSYTYDELFKKYRRKALAEVRQRYQESLGDDDKLVDLLRQQRTKFGYDGTFRSFVDDPFFVTNKDALACPKRGNGKEEAC